MICYIGLSQSNGLIPGLAGRVRTGEKVMILKLGQALLCFSTVKACVVGTGKNSHDEDFAVRVMFGRSSKLLPATKTAKSKHLHHRLINKIGG